MHYLWNLVVGYQYVPTRSGKTTGYNTSEVGRLPYSRPGAKFPYRKWIGNARDTWRQVLFIKLGKQGYVVGKTISRNSKRNIRNI